MGVLKLPAPSPNKIDTSSGAVSNGQVLVAVAVEIAHRDCNRTNVSAKVSGGAETARAIAQQDRYVV